jgi:hypothetical protein
MTTFQLLLHKTRYEMQVYLDSEANLYLCILGPF